MAKSSITKLAEYLFDKFIEVEDGFIEVDEILCVRRASYCEDLGEPEVEAVEIITKSQDGSFFAKIKFDDLVKEVHKLRERMKTKPVEPSPPPPNLEKPRPKVIPLGETTSPAPKKKTRRMEGVRIGIEKMDAQHGMATGTLPGAPRVVERHTIKILSSTGAVLGTGHQDGNGMVTGKVSGFVNESGQYRLVFAGYAGDAALISYTVEAEE